jgi:hypothetical protein
MRFEVREIHQLGSGGSHVVKYSAEMEILDAPQPFSVEITSVFPPERFSSEATETSRQMIQHGAVRAFDGSGKAARIRVENFVIHPVDWRPRYVEEYTFRTIRGILAAQSTSRTPQGL